MRLSSARSRACIAGTLLLRETLTQKMARSPALKAWVKNESDPQPGRGPSPNLAARFAGRPGSLRNQLAQIIQSPCAEKFRYGR